MCSAHMQKSSTKTMSANVLYTYAKHPANIFYTYAKEPHVCKRTPMSADVFYKYAKDNVIYTYAKEPHKNSCPQMCSTHMQKNP